MVFGAVVRSRALTRQCGWGRLMRQEGQQAREWPLRLCAAAFVQLGLTGEGGWSWGSAEQGWREESRSVSLVVSTTLSWDVGVGLE